jgi:hypothetical protein
MFDLDGPAPDPEPADPVCLLVDRRSHYECKMCSCAPGDQFSCYDVPRVVPGPNATALQLVDRTLDCTERRRRLLETSRNSTIHSRQELNWLADASRVAKLVADGQTDLAPVFWIRLYGVLHEIFQRLSDSAASLTQHGVKPPQVISDFMAAVDKVGSLFSDDELLYIQYRRDVECHPVQLNYEFRVKKDGGTREAFDHKVLAKKVPVSLHDFMAATRRVLATAPNEVALAQRFADRCWLALAGLKRKGARIYG